MAHQGSAALPVPGFESSVSLARAHTDEDVTPGEIAVGVIIGRSSEYFDFFVFGIASVLVFPSLLFPFLSRLDGTLMAFAIFALAFVARPVGTAISMGVQRRWGRGTKLTLALFLLGACTAGMAFLPSYASVGNKAIVALVILRIGQGLALGGSWVRRWVSFWRPACSPTCTAASAWRNSWTGGGATPSSSPLPSMWWPFLPVCAW